MLSVFNQLYKKFFKKNKVDFKMGDVIYAHPNQETSQKTRAIIKIYGKNGFIVCDTNCHTINHKKRSIKLISRQYVKKFNRKEQKLKKKVWVGWIPIEEISWTKKEKPKYFE
jgi:hypothetical protein|tara:strand:- start:56 stop:391 length:336 start_codon:yes stop_codon:yes gene_type:complete